MYATSHSLENNRKKKRGTLKGLLNTRPSAMYALAYLTTAVTL